MKSDTFWGGGQPDSDMKVDFAEIGIGKIGKIGISDFFNLKVPILANFGKIGNKLFFGIFYFLLNIRYIYRNINRNVLIFRSMSLYSLQSET